MMSVILNYFSKSNGCHFSNKFFSKASLYFNFQLIQQTLKLFYFYRNNPFWTLDNFSFSVTGLVHNNSRSKCNLHHDKRFKCPVDNTAGKSVPLKNNRPVFKERSRTQCVRARLTQLMPSPGYCLVTLISGKDHTIGWQQCGYQRTNGNIFLVLFITGNCPFMEKCVINKELFYDQTGIFN